MRKVIIGIVAAMSLAIAAPAAAQGVYFGAGPGGVGIGVGPGSGYYGGDYPRRYRSYDRGYSSYGYDRGRNCRTRLVETRYGMRRVTRCW